MNKHEKYSAGAVSDAQSIVDDKKKTRTMRM